MFASTSLALGAAAAAVHGASALRIPARAVPVPARRSLFSSSSGHGFQSQPVVANAAQDSAAGGTTSLFDISDNIYVINVTLGGADFSLQLDTGSVDLVLLPDSSIDSLQPPPMFSPPNVNASYGSGFMAGPLEWASLQFGEYSVDSQAFINGNTASSFFQRWGLAGIMGISLDVHNQSPIHRALDKSSETPIGGTGNAVLTNVFLQNSSLANTTSVFLARTADGEATDASTFTIGELDDDFQESIDAIAPLSTVGDGRWGISLDDVYVNGYGVGVTSGVKDAPDGKAIAVLDTGTSKALVPPAVVDAIYGAIDGAWTDDSGNWIVPCLGNYPNVTFTFGGVDYNIHPLDLTNIKSLDQKENKGVAVCTAAFTPLNIKGFSDFDFLLGDSFMRNIYTVYDYGSIGADGEIIDQPNIKMVSLADLAGSGSDYDDFVAARTQTLSAFSREASKEDVEGVLAVSGAADVSAIAAATADSTDGGSYQALVDKLDKFGPVLIGILAGIFVVLLALLGVSIAACVRGGRSVGAARSVNPSYAPVPLRFKEGEYKDEERYHG